MPIEDLKALANHHGIDVEMYPKELVGLTPRGRYREAGARRVVFMSPGLTGDPMRERCILAHEIAHGVTGCLGLLPHDETTADRWAQDLLMPDWWLKDRLWMPAWMLCEEAGVYQMWAEARLKRYLESNRA